MDLNQAKVEALREEKLKLVKQLESKDDEIKELQERLDSLKGPENLGKLPRAVTSSLHLPLVETKYALDNLDIERYSRQMILPEFRVKSQLCLSSKSVLVAGLSGLGCPVVAYLAAAGVGRLGLVDTGEVLPTDLGLIHQEDKLGVARVISAKCWLEGLNSSVDVVPFQLDPSSLCHDLVHQFDVMVDCTEDKAVSEKMEAACLEVGRPMVQAVAREWEGDLTVFNYHQENEDEETTTSEKDATSDPSCVGSVPAVQGVVGCLAALETIKLLTGLPVTLAGRRMVYDAKEGRCRTLVGRK